jgi:hypothetical protein
MLINKNVVYYVLVEMLIMCRLNCLQAQKKASPAPPTGQGKPVSYHRNPPILRERERERE